MSQKVQFQSEDFQVQEADEGDGKVVTGLALPYGETSRNGVKYDKDSVEENMDKMEGRSVLVNHDMDRPIGHVEEVQSTEQGMIYRMNIDPEEKINNTSAIRKFERGDVKNVSISAFVERVEGEKDLVKVKDFAELSAVTVPGFPQTTTNPEAAPTGVMAAESIDSWVSEYQDGDGSENFKSSEDKGNSMTEEDDMSEAFTLGDFESAAAQMLADAADVEVTEFSEVMDDYEFDPEDESVAGFISSVSDKSVDEVMDFVMDEEEDPEDDGEEPDDDGDTSDDGDEGDEAFFELEDEEYSKEEVIEALTSEEESEEEEDGEQDSDDSGEEEDGDDESEEGFGDGNTEQELGGEQDGKSESKDFSDVDMPEF